MGIKTASSFFSFLFSFLFFFAICCRFFTFSSKNQLSEGGKGIPLSLFYFSVRTKRKRGKKQEYIYKSDIFYGNRKRGRKKKKKKKQNGDIKHIPKPPSHTCIYTILRIFFLHLVPPPSRPHQHH